MVEVELDDMLVCDNAGSPTSRKDLGLTTAYRFNNLNQFASGSWTGGAITVAGAVNYPAGTVTVNSITGRIFPDRVFEVTNVTVTAGTNSLTAVYHGPRSQIPSWSPPTR